jgi:predicted dehydrogenase
VSKDVLGVAIVGSGVVSEFQARAIRDLPGARLVGFTDKIEDLARRRAEQFGARVFRSVEETVTDREVDVVSVCTPSGDHLDPALAAARAHKHVMVEKPVEVTAERVDAIVSACQAAGVTLGAIFPRRFYDTSRFLKAAIDSGRFGALSLGDVYVKWYRSQEYYDKGGWRGTWKLDGGGALMNQGIHGVDLIQWLMGGVEEVTGFVATRAHERIEVEDVATAAVKYRNGALGVIEGSTAAWPGSRLRVEVCGSAGHVVMEDEVILKWAFAQEFPEDTEVLARYGPRAGLSGGGAADPKAIDSEGHRRQFEDFLSAIREGRRPRCDGVEGRAAVAIITGIYRSARERGPVRVG